jgi:translation initiation factor 2 subunit 1
VSEEELAACEEKYNKSKLVHSIMRHVAETQGVDLVHLYSVVAWPLYKLYGHAYDAFKARRLAACSSHPPPCAASSQAWRCNYPSLHTQQVLFLHCCHAGEVVRRCVRAAAPFVQVMVLSPDEMWGKLKEVNAEAGRDDSVVTAGVKDAIMKNIKRRLTPQPLKIRADLEMTCFTHGGVECIKARGCSILGHTRLADCLQLLRTLSARRNATQLTIITPFSCTGDAVGARSSCSQCVTTRAACRPRCARRRR